MELISTEDPGNSKEVGEVIRGSNCVETEIYSDIFSLKQLRPSNVMTTYLC